MGLVRYGNSLELELIRYTTREKLNYYINLIKRSLDKLEMGLYFVQIYYWIWVWLSKN